MQPKYSTFHIFIYFDLKPLPSPVSCGSMECLNAQRCLLASPSHPPRPGSSFATMAALFTVSLAARRPYLPLPLSLCVHWDLCSCLQAAEEGLTEVVQRERKKSVAYMLVLGLKSTKTKKKALCTSCNVKVKCWEAHRSFRSRKWTKSLR